MMDDHFILSRARNHLADALKALLKAEVMIESDFRYARQQAANAVNAIDDLLREPHRHKA